MTVAVFDLALCSSPQHLACVRAIEQDGSVDTVASDHSPSTPDVKLFDTGDFLNSWGGFAGLCSLKP